MISHAESRQTSKIHKFAYLQFFDSLLTSLFSLLPPSTIPPLLVEQFLIQWQRGVRLSALQRSGGILDLGVMLGYFGGFPGVPQSMAYPECPRVPPRSSPHSGEPGGSHPLVSG